jgi:hypothetical protein
VRDSGETLISRRVRETLISLQASSRVAFWAGLIKGRVGETVSPWTLTTLREKLIKIGAKVVSHAKSVTFQLAEVAVPRALFAAILERIDRLRAAPSPGGASATGGWE